MGFFDEFENKKSLEVYSLGTPVFKINFDDFVCINSNCLDKEHFVSEYISKALYGDVMNDILSQKPLKIDSKITKTASGFVQEAKTDEYDIFFSVDKGKIYFLERVGGFKFEVRFMDGN